MGKDHPPRVDPLSIRILASDLDRIDRAADGVGMLRSSWIREMALQRARQILGGMKPPKLTAEKSSIARGVQICVRLNPEDWGTVAKAADVEGLLPSPWIRALLLKNINGDKGAVANEVASEETSRECEPDGSLDAVPLVGEPIITTGQAE